MQCLSIALALYAMIHVSIRGGACMNPAVGLVGNIYAASQLNGHDGDHGHAAYWWAYVFGPWVGGAIAGVAANVHIQCVEQMVAKNLKGGLLDNN